ncbi:MAG: anhydro-N-acetylmuramic acid kinase [Bacteroidetes bacterium]|nr:anhydro-N-acetylmuramic acid kinase [Bacteroidota bacterium]
MRTYKVIGIMSGSSMDGIDLALCNITSDNGKYTFSIENAETYEYNEKWRVRLSQLRKADALAYAKTDVFYGHYLGQLVNDFVSKNNLTPDLIASHGHTVFHYPNELITRQVGDGASLSAICGLPVVSDFRSMDVAKGGQGAPLVAIGDELLFSEYDYCLNLGGFSNISGMVGEYRIAYDISPANILLNRVARDLDLAYDKDGEIAAKGAINYQLLGLLNDIDFYKKPFPKSLNRDWINEELWHIVKEGERLSPEDKMKTFVDHIAFQIGKSIDYISGNKASNKKVLVTGGGAFNNTLMDYIRTHSEAEFIIPEKKLVEYKEALIFALMGVLRIENNVNIKQTFTGASSDSVSGSLNGNYKNLQ